MRRLLLSVGLALAVGGATLGAAAMLPIDPTSLSAGSTVVTSCDNDGSQVAWETSWTPGPPGFYKVDTVRLSGLDPACSTLAAEAIVQSTSLAYFAWAWGTWDAVAGDTFVFDFSSSNIPAAGVESLSVVIY